MNKNCTIKLNTIEFWDPEKLQYFPEDMFDLIDEAKYYNRKFVKVPYYLFIEYINLNPNEKLNGILNHPN